MFTTDNSSGNLTAADYAIQFLSSLNLLCKKISNKSINVYVDRDDRFDTIDLILDNCQNSYLDFSTSRSSMGVIRWDNCSIAVKPHKRQFSPGVDNEVCFANTINYYISICGPLTIILKGDNNEVSYPYVTKVSLTGRQTKNRQKNDAILHSLVGDIPVSIKKLTSEFWESADTIFGKSADSVIDHLVSQSTIAISELGVFRSDGVPKVHITPEIAIKASKDEAFNVIFGNDIFYESGVVIKDTFSKENFTFTKNTLTITAKHVISSLKNVPEELSVYFLIRNDITRTRPGSKYPGLRIQAVYKSRIKNAMIVKRP